MRITKEKVALLYIVTAYGAGHFIGKFSWELVLISLVSVYAIWVTPHSIRKPWDRIRKWHDSRVFGRDMADVKWYAIYAHRAVNQMYGKDIYDRHLLDVERNVIEYQHLISDELFPIALKAGWCHDLFEDTGVSYAKLAKIAGEGVAKRVFLLTTSKGKNRRESHGPAYYSAIASDDIATFVKLCDRLANIEASIKQKNKKKIGMYMEEHQFFSQMLFKEEFLPIFAQMDSLFKKITT